MYTRVRTASGREGDASADGEAAGQALPRELATGELDPLPHARESPTLARAACGGEGGRPAGVGDGQLDQIGAVVEHDARRRGTSVHQRVRQRLLDDTVDAGLHGV